MANFIAVPTGLSNPLASKLRNYIDLLRSLHNLGEDLAGEISQINGDISGNPDAMKNATGLASAEDAATVTNTIVSCHADILASGAAGQVLSRFG